MLERGVHSCWSRSVHEHETGVCMHLGAGVCVHVGAECAFIWERSVRACWSRSVHEHGSRSVHARESRSVDIPQASNTGTESENDYQVQGE